MITLDITPQTENQVRAIARRLGKPLTDYLVDLIEEHVANTEAVPETEEALLQQINLGLSEEEWEEYFILLRKQDDNILNDKEHERIAEIAEFLEGANAKRIQAVIQLADIRSTTFEALMAEFEISPIDYQNVAP